MKLLKTSINSSKATVLSLFKFPLKTFKNSRLDDFNFRDHRWNGGIQTNSYTPTFTLSEEEKILNDKLPLNQRILDYSKYMRHRGELKSTTAHLMVDVEPFPRLKIMMLCQIINDLLNEFDNKFIYKALLRELIKYIMEVVDEHESIVEIESALIDYESVENLIEKLHDEVTLLRKLLKNDGYKVLIEESNDDDDFEGLFTSAAMGEHGPSTNGEANTHRKHDRPERSKNTYDY